MDENERNRKDAWLVVDKLRDARVIWDPEALVAAGFSPDVVDKVTEIRESNLGDPKHTIYVKGKATNQIHGVVAMALAEEVLSRLGLKAEYAHGWQRYLRHIQNAIRVHLGIEPEPE